MTIHERIEELSKIGRNDDGSIYRKAGTKEYFDAVKLVSDWMIEDGMDTYIDEYHNLIGIIPGTDSDAKPIVVGSHIDTVPTGGKYDGVLGVLGGMEAAKRLKGTTKHPIQVVAFFDEEDSMSGSIGFSQSKSVYDIKAFLELHVEQGPVLDKRGADIGVVQGIVGQRRCKFTITGQPNHAGTTPMNMRDDALVKASELVSYVYQRASIYNELVATVGKLDVSPNLFSIIPGRVDLTLQIRDLDISNIIRFASDVASKFDLIYETDYESTPVPCDRNIMNMISDSTGDLSYIEMPSRASHDAQNFSKWPMGMIFVPSKDGISHSSEEYTSPEQCDNGIDVLTETIKKIQL